MKQSIIFATHETKENEHGQLYTELTEVAKMKQIDPKLEKGFLLQFRTNSVAMNKKSFLVINKQEDMKDKEGNPAIIYVVIEYTKEVELDFPREFSLYPAMLN